MYIYDKLKFVSKEIQKKLTELKACHQSLKMGKSTWPWKQMKTLYTSITSKAVKKQRALQAIM